MYTHHEPWTVPNMPIKGTRDIRLLVQTFYQCSYDISFLRLRANAFDAVGIYYDVF